MSKQNSVSGKVISRRLLLSSGALGAAALASHTFAATLSGPKRSATVNIEKFSAAGKSEGTEAMSRVEKTDAEWRKQLSALSFQVTRQEGTEAPFSGKYADNHAAGLYRCICCDTALFDAKTKFESGTGWPSFWQPISRTNIVEASDYTLGMRRTAVSCARCDAHLGHVFDDGPKPTGLRYCMNSVSLNFTAYKA
ncbi:MAG: peptide-methionine (R)-S-oxide reductase MsrB [Steroidobacteraceae bacterium]